MAAEYAHWIRRPRQTAARRTRTDAVNDTTHLGCTLVDSGVSRLRSSSHPSQMSSLTPSHHSLQQCRLDTQGFIDRC